jgi:hypothetical protein
MKKKGRQRLAGARTELEEGGAEWGNEVPRDRGRG